MEEFYIVAPRRTNGFTNLCKAVMDRMYYDYQEARKKAKSVNRKISTKSFTVYLCRGWVLGEVRTETLRDVSSHRS